jgi:pyrimidine operon attenuation protein/uracil phosphoribosyltransferase
MPLREKAQLMSESEVERTVVHLAHEIVEKTEAMPDVALVGIRRRGVHLAERLARKVEEIASVTVPVGTLDIQFYRDDVSREGLGKVGQEPVVKPSQIPFPVTDKDVILVDDVLFTGRTARAAMEALFDHGRPRRVRLCVLIDRGHRELPIEAAFVGKRVPTGAQDHIEVRLREEDPAEKVLMLEASMPEASMLKTATPETTTNEPERDGGTPRSRPKG